MESLTLNYIDWEFQSTASAVFATDLCIRQVASLPTGTHFYLLCILAKMGLTATKKTSNRTNLAIVH